MKRMIISLLFLSFFMTAGFPEAVRGKTAGISGISPENEGRGGQLSVGKKKKSEKTSENIYPADTLAVFSFNDFHGAFVPGKGVPGAAALSAMMQREKSKFVNSIVVSGGDNFSGSYFSRITRGEPLAQMFAQMGVEISAVGNHEFDWGMEFFRDTALRYTHYISANITENGYENPAWLPPYKIVGRILKDGTLLRIAFIGLSTTDTPVKTSPENIEGLQFIHPLGAAHVQTLYNLKKEGKIDMIILLVHIGTNMDDPYIIDEGNARFLPYMEAVDAIISAHSHKRVLARVNNIPIIQAGCNGSHIGRLLFKIEGPGRIVFLQGDTLPVRAPADPLIERAVNRVMDKFRLSDTLTYALDDLVKDAYVNKFEYIPLGAYITDAYAEFFREHAPADSLREIPVIGINHYGGIRASLARGPVTRIQAGNVLPFGGAVTAYRFNGRRLKELLREGRMNKNGFLQTSRLVFTADSLSNRLSGLKYIGKITDRSGRTVEKEVLLQDDTPCIVVLDEFITEGGDGYPASLFRGYEIREFNAHQYETTGVFIRYLQKQSRISAGLAPLPRVNPPHDDN